MPDKPSDYTKFTLPPLMKNEYKLTNNVTNVYDLPPIKVVIDQ
jgi:hypothetical protein